MSRPNCSAKKVAAAMLFRSSSSGTRLGAANSIRDPISYRTLPQCGGVIWRSPMRCGVAMYVQEKDANPSTHRADTTGAAEDEDAAPDDDTAADPEVTSQTPIVSLSGGALGRP